MKKPWSGIFKQQARQQIISPGKKYASILTLPGSHMEDVRFLLEQGVVDQSTRLVMVERDRTVAKSIRRRMRSTFAEQLPNWTLFEGELTDYATSEEFDLIHIDLMGSLNLALLRWIGDLNLKPGCDLAINLSDPRKNQQFYRRLEDTFLLYGLGRAFYWNLAEKYRFFREQKVLDRINIAAIVAAMNRHSVIVCPIEDGDIYRDHVNVMHLYRFRILRQTRPRLPTLTDMLANQVAAPTLPKKPGVGIPTEAIASLARLWVDAETSGSKGKMSYVTMRLRQHQQAASLRGKSPTRALAAVKAWKTRIARSSPILE